MRNVKIISVWGAGKKIDGYELFREYYADYLYDGCTPEEHFNDVYKREGWDCTAKGMNKMEGPFRTRIEALAAIIENCPSKEMAIVSAPEGDELYIRQAKKIPKESDK